VLGADVGLGAAAGAASGGLGDLDFEGVAVFEEWAALAAVKTLIETRGEGRYFVCAGNRPGFHTTGRLYRQCSIGLGLEPCAVTAAAVALCRRRVSS
jgi:hypothetical protein